MSGTQRAERVRKPICRSKSGGEMPGTLRIPDDDRLAAGGGIAGDSLTETDTEGVEDGRVDCGVDVEGDFEGQFISFQQEQ